MNHKFYGKLLETASKAGQHLSTSARSLPVGRVVVLVTEVMLSWPTNGSRKVRQQHPARLLSCKVYSCLLCLLPPVATSVIWHRYGMMDDVGNPPCIDHWIVDFVGKPMDFRNFSSWNVYVLEAAGNRDGVHFNFMVEAYAKVHPVVFSLAPLCSMVPMGFQWVYLGCTWVYHVPFATHVFFFNFWKMTCIAR